MDGASLPRDWQRAGAGEVAGLARRSARPHYNCAMLHAHLQRRPADCSRSTVARWLCVGRLRVGLLRVGFLRVGLLHVGFLVVCWAQAGCQKSLFPASTPRTQFERYDTLRAGAAPMEEPDVFGTSQPALRARLTPKTPQ